MDDTYDDNHYSSSCTWCVIAYFNSKSRALLTVGLLQAITNTPIVVVAVLVWTVRVSAVQYRQQS